MSGPAKVKHHIPGAEPCPRCGCTDDWFLKGPDEGPPTEGDIFECLECGQVVEVVADGLRPLTTAEADLLAYPLGSEP